jgi:predicted metal-dependent hydrolase
VPDGVAVTYRRMRFPLDENVPRYWHSGSPFITHFFNALSVVFPEGEKFFIDSVRAYEEEIRDPVTRAEVREFVKQEAHHTYQHRILNDLVARHGVDMARYDALLGRALRWARRVLPRSVQLATTIALEHFTAILAHQLLTNPKATEGMHPDVKPLWLWHAVEETEHKAVCFDVYQQVGGGYLNRALNMARVMLGFLLGISAIQMSLLRADGKPFDRRDFASGLRYLWGRGGLLRSILPDLFAFFRPGFHPWQKDNRELIAAWAEQYGGYVEPRGERA